MAQENNVGQMVVEHGPRESVAQKSESAAVIVKSCSAIPTPLHGVGGPHSHPSEARQQRPAASQHAQLLLLLRQRGLRRTQLGGQRGDLLLRRAQRLLLAQERPLHAGLCGWRGGGGGVGVSVLDRGVEGGACA